MTAYDFTDHLIERWSVKEAILQDIQNELKNYSPESIDKIWMLFNREYEKTSPPNFGSIYKTITTHSIRREVSKRKPDDNMVFKCSDCGTYYAEVGDSMRAYCCPECLSLDRSCVKFTGQKVFYVQSPCMVGWEDMNDKPIGKTRVRSKCPALGDIRAYGPSCQQYGTKYSGPECRDCLCRKCCAVEKKEREALQ